MLRTLSHSLACPFLFISCATPALAAHPDASAALIMLAADDIDRVLGDVQASTEAVAHEYELLYQSAKGMNPANTERWTKRLTRQAHTTQFNTWDGAAHEPSYQQPVPAYYAYGDTGSQKKQLREIAIFNRLAPVLRAAYNTFEFSWTYLTTADDMMLLYPFLTLDQAVNNYPPTRQVFYTRADFTHRQCGWTHPYLDLAGAGMMVTVSCPALSAGTPIGVTSHDITLAQLSAEVLKSLARDAKDTAYMVDTDGLVVAVSDSELRKEAEKVNRAAGKAIMHYRISSASTSIKTSSKAAWINKLTERLVNAAARPGAPTTLHIEGEAHSAWATRIHHTGWIVVLALPTYQSLDDK